MSSFVRKMHTLIKPHQKSDKSLHNQVRALQPGKYTSLEATQLTLANNNRPAILQAALLAVRRQRLHLSVNVTKGICWFKFVQL